MAFITAGSFKKGISVVMDDNIQVIVDFLHVKPGKGAAFVRTKIRNIVTGAVLEKTFNPNDKFEIARIDRKKMEYSYNDGNIYYFMDSQTYEMVPLEKDMVEDALKFIKENMVCEVAFYKGKAFSVDPENFVELEVVECEPGIAGATAQPGTKLATLETGFTLQVPLFVNKGDKVRVDTRTGIYMSRI